jgi:hypothetical protein
MQPHDTQPGAGIPEQFDRISATVLGAHEAPLREAFDASCGSGAGCSAGWCAGRRAGRRAVPW